KGSVVIGDNLAHRLKTSNSDDFAMRLVAFSKAKQNYLVGDSESSLTRPLKCMTVGRHDVST
ncbi:MAG TPA: hypothetical protein VEQ09_07655, partial [Aquabacterium sp.]|nr:hypothetical protein [Aquabacterium sp.]